LFVKHCYIFTTGVLMQGLAEFEPVDIGGQIFLGASTPDGLDYLTGGNG
jgi:hypothetical protein